MSHLLLESRSRLQKIKNDILSGSFVVSGNALAEVVHVGSDNYTAKISAEAKYIKKLIQKF